jgi:hypothetical protein
MTLHAQSSEKINTEIRRLILEILPFSYSENPMDRMLSGVSIGEIMWLVDKEKVYASVLRRASASSMFLFVTLVMQITACIQRF